MRYLDELVIVICWNRLGLVNGWKEPGCLPGLACFDDGRYSRIPPGAGSCNFPFPKL